MRVRRATGMMILTTDITRTTVTPATATAGLTPLTAPLMATAMGFGAAIVDGAVGGVIGAIGVARYGGFRGHRVAHYGSVDASAESDALAALDVLALGGGRGFDGAKRHAQTELRPAV